MLKQVSGTEIVAQAQAAASRATSPNLPSRRQEAMPITNPSRLPALSVPDVDRGIPNRVVCFWRGSDRTDPLLRRPLADEERSALERRAADLASALLPAPSSGRNELIGAIEAMLGSFQQMQRHDQATAKAIAVGYLWTVRERPHWAVLRACELVRKGEAEGVNREHPPSEGVFNTAVGRLVADYAKRLAETEALLRAEVDEEKPRLSREEIEAKIGRAVRDQEPKPVASTRYADGDGKHLERVMADLAARKARNASFTDADRRIDAFENGRPVQEITGSGSPAA